MAYENIKRFCFTSPNSGLPILKKGIFFINASLVDYMLISNGNICLPNNALMCRRVKALNTYKILGVRWLKNWLSRKYDGSNVMFWESFDKVPIQLSGFIVAFQFDKDFCRRIRESVGCEI